MSKKLALRYTKLFILPDRADQGLCWLILRKMHNKIRLNGNMTAARALRDIAPIPTTTSAIQQAVSMIHSAQRP
jgi:hypothetical protein